jgi:ATP-binding cassette subfamily C protein
VFPKPGRDKSAADATGACAALDPAAPDSGPRFIAFLRFLFSVQSARLLRTILVVLATAGAEAAALLLLLPLLAAIGVASDSPRLALLPSWITTDGHLGVIVALYALILCLIAGLTMVQTRLLMGLQYRVMVQLQRETFDAMLRSRWSYLVRRTPAQLVATLTHDIRQVGLGAYHVCTAMAALVVFAVYLGFAMQISPEGTLLVILSGLALSPMLHAKGMATQLSGRRLTQANRAMLHELHEQMAGLKTIKAHGLEPDHTRLFAERTEALRRGRDETVEQRTAAALWQMLGGGLTLCAAVYLLAGPLQRPAAEIVALIAVFSRLLPRLSALHQSYQHLRLSLSSYAELRRLDQGYVEHAEPTATEAEPPRLRHAIALQDLSFGYAPGCTVFRDLSLTLHAHQTTVLVGPSGAGKTTLADLVLGLLHPSGGRILIDDVELSAHNAALWRRRIGYLSQEVFLFHDSIRNNLRWSNPEATEAELWQALDDAAAGDFVRALPEGLDALVGDRGVRLSGGQRQRLVLARVLLRQPDLLILDEATSWLDRERERAVLDSLRRLRGRLTILMVTHRLEAAREADRVLNIEAGRVVDAKTPSRPTIPMGMPAMMSRS